MRIFSFVFSGGGNGIKLPQDRALRRSTCRAMVRHAFHYHASYICTSCSDFADSQRLTHFLELEFVDPWGFDNGGRVHVRLSDQLWSELQSTLPECSVVIENVEEYVLAAEMQMISKSPDIKAETVRSKAIHAQYI